MTLTYALFVKTFTHLYLQVDIAALAQDNLAHRLWTDDQVAYFEVFTNIFNGDLRRVNSPLSKLDSSHPGRAKFIGLRESNVGKNISWAV